MTTTYCDSDDVEAILSTAGVSAFVDDDESGARSAAETAFITSMTERAAVRMNVSLCQRYTLSELTSNAWCKWCNATIAAHYVTTRRGHPAIGSLETDVTDLLEVLQDIQHGKAKVPEQADSYETIPTVSNYTVERGRSHMPVRVVTEESTGSAPGSGITRRSARDRQDVDY